MASDQSTTNARVTEYVTQVQVHTTRQILPKGIDRTDIDARIAADIETEIVFRGHTQLCGDSLNEALETVRLDKLENLLERDHDE